MHSLLIMPERPQPLHASERLISNNESVTERGLRESKQRLESHKEPLYPERATPAGRRLVDHQRAIEACWPHLHDGSLKDRVLKIGLGRIMDAESPTPRWVFASETTAEAISQLLEIPVEDLGVKTFGKDAPVPLHTAAKYFLENPAPVLALIRRRIDIEHSQQGQTHAEKSRQRNVPRLSLEKMIDESDCQQDLRLWISRWTERHAGSLQKIIYNEELRETGVSPKDLPTLPLLIRALDVYFQNNPEIEAALQSGNVERRLRDFTEIKLRLLGDVLDSVEVQDAAERERMERARRWLNGARGDLAL